MGGGRDAGSGPGDCGTGGRLTPVLSLTLGKREEEKEREVEGQSGERAERQERLFHRP